MSDGEACRLPDAGGGGGLSENAYPTAALASVLAGEERADPTRNCYLVLERRNLVDSFPVMPGVSAARKPRLTDTARRESRWLEQDGVDWILKVSPRQLDILRLTVSQTTRFTIADLARELVLPWQVFADCLKLLETRGLVQVERIDPGRDKAFIAKAGPILQAVSKVSLSGLAVYTR